MTNSDKVISLIILGLLAPVVLMLLFWWGSIPFVKDDALIMYLALGGLAAGVILDFTLLRGFVFKLFKLPLNVLTAVEIFYSIMVYGLFMGFPVFNSLVGIFGSYIAARGGVVQKKSREEILKSSRYINRISTGILLFLCICTAVLALRESSICLQIKGMLNLPFNVTMGMVWMLIIIGGGLLLWFQYYFSVFVSKRVLSSLAS